ncbi:MAG: formylmethanofuran dehydrogenase [Methanotrichaceae archaeon]|nr:formylmethanofuran dehydrogenase [Methanotrichaceae archaeon]
MEEILKKIADPEMLSQVEKVVPFHGYLSTGALVGIQMLNIARRVLEASEGDRLFVTCETYNCLPDPFQVLAGATIGNKGLKIMDHGKMAVTVSKRAPVGTKVTGVRIMLDPLKTARYSRLHAWFMKTEKVPHSEVVPILLSAGESLYTWEIVDLDVPEKPRKEIAICECCKESFIQKDGETFCLSCMNGSTRS